MWPVNNNNIVMIDDEVGDIYDNETHNYISKRKKILKLQHSLELHFYHHLRF